ncbi:MAG: NAD-dependent epimerase/dehydratase family protein [Chloroflexota bacterium]
MIDRQVVEHLEVAPLPPGSHVIVTGGAGYIGSLLVGELLRRGYRVSVVDDLLYGGESLLAYFSDPNFRFVKVNVWEPRVIRDAVIDAGRAGWPAPYGVMHLAALVGFPACQAVGRQVAWRYNVEATERVFEQAVSAGAKRFIYPSTYNVYALATDGKVVTEQSPLSAQSLYAETKLASERYLLGQAHSDCVPVIFRLAHLYGVSPRTRFDTLINQFVLDAYLRRALLIYQRGYSRSFIHVRDAVRGLLLGLQVEKSDVFNLGSEAGNHSKDDIVGLITRRLPETSVSYKDMTFGGDMRDITVSFEKIKTELGFQAQFTAEDGVREVLNALKSGLIRDPQDAHYRNSHFIVS